MNDARVRALSREFRELGADAGLILSPANIFYLSGMLIEPFERMVCLVVGRDGGTIAVLPALESEVAKQYFEPAQVMVWRDGEDPAEVLRQALLTVGMSSGGTLALEAGRAPVRLGDWLRSQFRSASFVDLSALLYNLRSVKDADEIARIKKACEITTLAFQQALEFLSPGVTELQVAARLDMLMKSNGADGLAYATTVLSGERAAFPHGRSSRKTIERGDLVLIDMGASVDGYCADFTRTVLVGKGQWDRYVAMYGLVAEAQVEAKRAIRKGARAGEVDTAARRIIDAAGWGAHFIHRTGHGLGIEIHEPPSLAPGNEEVLLPGMVTTVEPGLYFAGWGGVRLEDTVLVTENGAVTLTEASREPTAV